MKTRIDIALTKEEFEHLLFNHFSSRGTSYPTKDTLVSFYRWGAGNVDIVIESESVHESRSSSSTGSFVTGSGSITGAERAEVDAVVGNAFGFGPLAGDPPPKLWSPAPPVFVKEVLPRTKNDYFPTWEQKPYDSATDTDGKACKCGVYLVHQGRGWVDEYEQLHQLDECEGHETAPVDATAVLSASSTGEHGTVEGDDGIPF